MRKLILLSLLLLPLSAANASISLQQTSRQNLACGTVSSCTVSGFSAIPTGSAIFATAIASGATTIAWTAGSSNAGTWVVPSGCTTNAACNANNGAASIAAGYILTTTGTPTTIICTTTTAVMTSCDVQVYSFTNSPMSFDVGTAASSQCAGGTNCAGTSAGTLTGTNDIIVQYAVFTGSSTVCPNSAASPADSDGGGDWHNCGLINSTNNAAGNYTNIASTVGRGAIALKEAAAAGGTTGESRRQRMERLEE